MRRVAVLGDVHGNAVALAAVLRELEYEDVDAVVWTGDLSWGWEPLVTLELVRSLDVPGLYVRGNAERALLELRAGGTDEPTDAERWILAQHDGDALDFVAGFEASQTVSVQELGPGCFCHGSPRSDEELLTAETPAARVAAATAGIGERLVVSGHTHSQYDRRVAGVRLVNPGSVGLPYEGRHGAYWALLGPDVELRRTEYDIGAACGRIRSSGYPGPERLIETLTSPPTPAEMIEHAERLEFSG